MIKSKIQTNREQSYTINLDQITERMTKDQKKATEPNQRTESYNWLISFPLKEHSYILNKQQLWDVICVRYNWAVPNLPALCKCGLNYNL